MRLMFIGIATSSMASLANANTCSENIVQIAGNDSVIQCGDHNVAVNVKINNFQTIVSTTPEHYIKQTQRALQQLQRENRILQARNEQLEQRVAALETLVADTLAKQQPPPIENIQRQVEDIPPVREEVANRLVETVSLEKQIATITDTDIRQRATTALENADLEAVSAIIRQEGPQRDYNHAGLAFEQSKSHNISQSINAIALVLDANLMGADSPAYVGKYFSAILVYGGGGFAIGKTSGDRGDHTTFNFDVILGPRLRFGGQTSLVVHGYYYCPIFEHIDRSRWPLIGAGVTASLQRPSFRIDAMYRWSTSHVLYDDGYNEFTLGAALVLHLPDKGH